MTALSTIVSTASRRPGRVLAGLALALGVLLAFTGPATLIPLPVLAWPCVALLLTLFLGVPGVWMGRRAARGVIPGE